MRQNALVPFFVFLSQTCHWTFPVSSDKRDVRTRNQGQRAPYVVSFSSTQPTILAALVSIFVQLNLVTAFCLSLACI